jgi:hypothetical protein
MLYVPISVVKLQRSNVVQTVRVCLQVVEHNLEVLMVVLVSMCQIERVLVVSGLQQTMRVE